MKIEINIEKKHFLGIVTTIFLLFCVTLVIAKTTTSDWDASQVFHDLLYADKIAGMSGNTVTVDDNLVVTGSLNAPGVVPSGFCIFSPTSQTCPTGWTDVSVSGGSMHTKTVRADSANVGGIGGDDRHTHGITSQAVADSGSYIGVIYSVLPASSWPPYKNVIICCKN